MMEALDALQWASSIFNSNGLKKEFKVLRCVYLNIHAKSNGSLIKNLKTLLDIIEHNQDINMQHKYLETTTVEDKKVPGIIYDELGVPSPQSDDCST